MLDLSANLLDRRCLARHPFTAPSRYAGLYPVADRVIGIARAYETPAAFAANGEVADPPATFLRNTLMSCGSSSKLVLRRNLPTA